MIHSQDRSGYFGASDTGMVLATNYKTKSFAGWWGVKLGEHEPLFQGNLYTKAGNRYEHPVLRTISEEMTLDRQIIIEKLKLRVNYDGDLTGTIYEVKTHKSEKAFKVSKAYWRQAQVEMYAYQQEFDDFKKLYIVSYALYPDEYYLPENVGVVIDQGRIRLNEVKYDKHFIKDEYLPALKEKARWLKKGKWPK